MKEFLRIWKIHAIIYYESWKIHGTRGVESFQIHFCVD